PGRGTIGHRRPPTLLEEIWPRPARRSPVNSTDSQRFRRIALTSQQLTFRQEPKGAGSMLQSPSSTLLSRIISRELERFDFVTTMQRHDEIDGRRCTLGTSPGELEHVIGLVRFG